MSRYGSVKNGRRIVRDYQFYHLMMYHFEDIHGSFSAFLKWFDINKITMLRTKEIVEEGTRLTPALRFVLPGMGFTEEEPFAQGAIRDFIISQIDKKVCADFWRVVDSKIRRNQYDHKL